jgi:hypothetical protein
MERESFCVIVQDIIKEIDALELSEKILLVEEIWDSIASHNETLPLLQWQKMNWIRDILLTKKEMVTFINGKRGLERKV